MELAWTRLAINAMDDMIDVRDILVELGWSECICCCEMV
jgi:hypothetical protein